jgi:hypothetical protein
MKYPVLLGCVLVVTACQAQEAAIADCAAKVAVKSGDYSHALAAVTTTPRHVLAPTFFGFNVEWLEFQSALWDPTIKSATGAVVGGVRPAAVAYLKANFPGAVYRYPGGSNSNYFDWSVAVGPLDQRVAKKQVTWANPGVVGFGPDEYLKFVRDVGGQAWYVANLYGTTAAELPADQLAASAGKLAAFLKTERTSGLPGILRWELGNELERSPIWWQPEKVSSKAAAVEAAILAADSSAKFISFLQEFAALPTVTSAVYNTKVAASLKDVVKDYAMHLYYDGEPNGQPINQKMYAVCRAINNAKSGGVTSPAIWVTEHGRIPPGAFAKPDWSYLYSGTADMTAALGVADFLIAAAQIPEIKGNMVHALHASSGPWPTLHQPAGTDAYPAATMVAMTALRAAMLPNVLDSTTTSKNVSAYGGGYDFRAVTMSDDTRKHYTIWAVNRSTQRIVVKFKLPALKSLKLNVAFNHVNKTGSASSNYSYKSAVAATKETVALPFDANGETSVTLYPESVSTFTIDPTLIAK